MVGEARRGLGVPAQGAAQCSSHTGTLRNALEAVSTGACGSPLLPSTWLKTSVSFSAENKATSLGGRVWERGKNILALRTPRPRLRPSQAGGRGTAVPSMLWGLRAISSLRWSPGHRERVWSSP